MRDAWEEKGVDEGLRKGMREGDSRLEIPSGEDPERSVMVEVAIISSFILLIS